LASFTARISCRLKGGGQVSMNLMNFIVGIAPCVKLLHFVVDHLANAVRRSCSELSPGGG